MLSKDLDGLSSRRVFDDDEVERDINSPGFLVCDLILRGLVDLWATETCSSAVLDMSACISVVSTGTTSDGLLDVVHSSVLFCFFELTRNFVVDELVLSDAIANIPSLL